MLNKPRRFTYALLLATLAGSMAVGSGHTALADNDHRSRKIELPGDAVFPEGVAIQESTGTFFAGSTTDGTIFSGNVYSNQPAGIFSPGGADGRTTAVGMKVDRDRLFVAGGGLGQVFVYDIASASLLAKFPVGLTPSFVNDVGVSPNGDAYFTDSLSPAVYRLSADLQSFERFTDFAGTPLVYGPGFNLNGIAATPDGASLITVQSNVGKLFRIDIATKQVTEINLMGANVTAGDGILLKGQRLYVLRNAAQLLLTFKLSDDLTSAKLTSVLADPGFQFPTTFARFDDNFLVVNSQFDKRATEPVLPFNVLAIPIPKNGNGKRLVADLKGTNEVTGGDPDGTGSALIRLRPNKGEVCFRIDVQNILLPATLSHIHQGNAGVNGPVVVDFQTAPDAKGRAKGCVASAVNVINAIWSNPAGHYVNVHNSEHPGGAVRGQLAQEPKGDHGDDDKDEEAEA